MIINNGIFLGYAGVNLLIAIILYFKLRKSFIAQFYTLCVIYLISFGAIGSLYGYIDYPLVQNVLANILVFIYSFFPFIFLHFIIIFVGYSKILNNKVIVTTIYSAGLFTYLMILSDFIPSPFLSSQGVITSGTIFYITWMSILFTLGAAQLYSIISGFSDKVIKTKFLFSGFLILVLFLPGPFAESIFQTLLGDYGKWYYVSSVFALIASIYIVFRHRTSVHLLDALKTSMELLKDILIKTDENFIIEMAQGAIDKLLGVSERSLIGKQLSEVLFDGSYLDDYKQYATDKIIKEGMFDARITLPDEEEVLMNFSIAPVIEADTVYGYLLIGRDITVRKKMEEELRIANEELEQRVRERTAELAELNKMLQLDIDDRKKNEERLRTLTTELKNTVASKDKMFSIVAHDLRNPFVSLLGFSEILVQEIESLSKADAQQFAQNIYTASKRVYHLLENLLQWARIQTGRIDFGPSIFKLTEILDNVLILYEGGILKKNLKIKKSLPEDVQTFADKNMIETVLRNLFSNSIKFTHENGEINFSIVRTDNEFEISIADNGTGIKKEIQEKLFSVDNITSTPDTENFKGSGLGLILSKEFVEKNGGKLWFESEENVGATFYFTIPFRQKELDKSDT